MERLLGIKEDTGEDNGARSGRNLGKMAVIIMHTELKMKPMDQKTAPVKRNMKSKMLCQAKHVRKTWTLLVFWQTVMLVRWKNLEKFYFK